MSAGSSYAHQSRVDALAIGLPSITGAPAVGGHECLVHERGFHVIPGAGGSGRTKFDPTCLALVERREEHAQRMERARFLVEIGDVNGARAELGLPPLPPPTPCVVEERAEIVECRRIRAGFPEAARK